MRHTIIATLIGLTGLPVLAIKSDMPSKYLCERV